MDKYAAIFDGAEVGMDLCLDEGEFGVFYETGGGAGDYALLENKPKINGVTVQGEKTGADYRLQDLMGAITPQEIDEIIYGGRT